MRVRQVVAVAATVVALALLLSPLPFDPTSHVPHGDKLAHATLCAGLTTAWRMTGLQRRWLVVSGLIFAVATELAQWAMHAGRHGDVYDALADLAGVTVAVVAITFAKRAGRTPGIAGTDPR